jgi:hypothetical protein
MPAMAIVATHPEEILVFPAFKALAKLERFLFGAVAIESREE